MYKINKTEAPDSQTHLEGNTSLALSQTVRGEAATGGAVGSVCFTLDKQTVEQTRRPACTHSCTSWLYTLYSCEAPHTLCPTPRSNAVKR